LQVPVIVRHTNRAGIAPLAALPLQTDSTPVQLERAGHRYVWRRVMNNKVLCAETRQTWRPRLGARAGERGQAMIETALVLPIILLISVSIFEFGRAYQTVQVLTNAAREGARLAVLPSSSVADVQSRVSTYMEHGQLPDYASATVAVDQNVTMTVGAGTASASVVTVSYPFSFIDLNPVANLVKRGSVTGKHPLTLTAKAEMRNEVQAF
jgi:Flp pilus assembly protein TadG